jgi:hypothetical protein
MLFNLYKKRDFGAYISDSIEFFKQFWKNYFLNFITLNGALMLILCMVYFFIFKDMFGEMMSNPGAEPSMFLDENMGTTIILMIVGMLVSIVFTLITTAYPIVYFRLVQKTDKETFTASEILNEIKKDLLRIIAFGLLSMVTFIPILMAYFLLSMVLSILLVGIPLFILGIGASVTWMNQALYFYLNERLGFIDSMRAGWRTLFSKFWHIAGASTAMIFIVQTLSGVASMIPYFIGLGKMISSGSGGTPDMEGAMPWMIAFYVINIVLTYILSNFIYINQGLIYYSSKEEQEHFQANLEIDTIGMNEE